jgi:hypothetical protein
VVACAFVVASLFSFAACGIGCEVRDVESIKTMSTTNNRPTIDVLMSIRGVARSLHPDEENGESCSDGSPGKMLLKAPGWFVEGVSADDVVEGKAASLAGTTNDEVTGGLCVSRFAPW